MSGNDTVITVSYFPPQLKIVPNTFDFGHHVIGDTVSSNFVLTNLSSSKPLNISKIILAKINQNFLITFFNPTPPVQLAPGASCSFTVQFTANTSGSFSDSIGVAVDSCNYSFWESSGANKCR